MDDRIKTDGIQVFRGFCFPCIFALLSWIFVGILSSNTDKKYQQKSYEKSAMFTVILCPVITYETVRELAFELPDVEEGTSYGTPALKVKGKLFVRLKEDGETIVLKTTYEEREELMAHEPETYFITDHYLNYPYILVSLERVSVDALRELVRSSYLLARRGRNGPITSIISRGQQSS